MTPKFHNLTVKDIRKETRDTVSISFLIPEELELDYHFESGQYLTLKTSINNEEVRRSYSLCSSPFEKEWRVAVKQIENGVFSTYANKVLKIGDKLDVMTPAGNFKVTTGTNKKSYVLFAAGSGITPVFSIAKTILEDENGDVTLFYGNKGFHGIIFREELEALKNKYLDRLRVIHIFSRESPGNKIQKGRINKEKCGDLYNAFLKNQNIDEVFICGPEDMILNIRESLIENGVESSKIHFELFATNIKKEKKIEVIGKESPSFASKVQIIVDGDTIDFELDSNGLTILDAAQEAGADLPFACKGGVCCTCKAKILEGSAKMDVNYALMPDEVENGYILTCQAHPTSEKLLVSFDD
ncbi:MAG: phenylacetic acid degradation protein [Flavobacteriales bacterium]|nr:phenylacetic acid degradation protein [Crocinitomicaceae bacterium]NBX79678.1 phenylacetic acid degradation protein [Flavobacteriales bacterium]NCA20244.1 phenylacetic acid degradation protein [Crocinitomicaceae bacterium]